MRTVVVTACSLLIGCAVNDASTTSTTSQAATVKNKLAGNKLAGNKLAGNKLAGNKLAGNKLAGNKLQLNGNGAGDLLATQDGRDVLSYVIGCALPDGVVLEADVPPGTVASPDAPYTCGNGVCDFPGQIGLTPHWQDHPLDKKGKGWISACLFARVNAHDTSEEISLRGENPALTVGADEAAIYSVEEGAFYGDWFTPDGEPVNWIACEGEGQASGEFGGLVDRDCTEPDPNNPAITQCGFKYAGHCHDYTPQYPSPFACADFESVAGHESFYDHCFDSPVLGVKRNNPGWAWGHRRDCDGDGDHDDQFCARMYDEVITTYVTP